MVSVVKETNETLLGIVNDLKNRAEESRVLLADIQSKMDSKLDEAKKYKVQVDDAKANIKRLDEEIKSLEADLLELKDKYGKKNLVAVIEAGTKEINVQIKQKQEEIMVHKNKIAELTNRARSIKDLLLNLKKDKKIKEERLNDLETSVRYYDARLGEIIDYANEHDNLNDYFEIQSNILEEDSAIVVNDSINVFDDIASIDGTDEEVNEEIFYEPVTDEEADEVFSQVIDGTEKDDEEESVIVDNIVENDEVLENDIIKSNDVDDNNIVENNEIEKNEEDSNLVDDIIYEPIVDKVNEEVEEKESLEDTHNLEISDLLSAVKEPIKEPEKTTTLESLNKAIDEEFSNIFGQNINVPINTTNVETDIFGKEFNDNSNSESNIINSLTNLGLDYYAFSEEDRKYIVEHYNEQTVSGIVNILKENKINLENIYESANLLGEITSAELSNIISKLLNVGQSSEAIGFVLDKLPLVDINLLNTTINNYGDYIQNVDITDLIIKSLKGGK